MLCFPYIPKLLASASYDDTVKLYREEEDDWVCCATLEGHESTVWSLAFDPSGQRLASCSDDRTVRIWRQYLPGNEQGELKETHFHEVEGLLGVRQIDETQKIVGRGACATRGRQSAGGVREGHVEGWVGF